MRRRLPALLTLLSCAGAVQAARNGRSMVFAGYDGNAIELWRLALASGAAPPSVLPRGAR